MNKRRIYLTMIDMAIFMSIFAFFSHFITIGIAAGTLSQRQSALHCVAMLGCVFGVRFVFGIYVQIWRYANVRDYLNLILADALGGMLYMLFDRLVFKNSHLMVASSIAIVSSALMAGLSVRFIYQRLRFIHQSRKAGGGDISRISVAVIGAGLLGTALVQELQSNPRGRYIPYCFIDSNRSKVGSRVGGLPVYGEHEDLTAQFSALPVQEIIIAIDSLSPEDLQALYTRYRQTGLKVKVYAHPLEAAVDTGPRVRELRIEDLLYRDAVTLSGGNIDGYYKGKTVLITGGGGSIGSELARQVAMLGPARLIILDIYENNANDIQQELLRLHGSRFDVVIEIASIRDAEKLHSIFDRYRPDIVFHAAAHKHVHLMEHNPEEAVKNNVFGTYNVVCAAEQAGVGRFILISTDKAVNPTNIMGATKRLCEMIVQNRPRGATRFAAVRFGNVLGSNGSVIPLFRRQIEDGGPLTLTDKRIIRYFMTISEAAQLLLQTGAMADNGEIFVLDMGKPVRILDLAENMIRLSGLVPYKDIQIVEVGLRPGEKLYEELLMKTKVLDKTVNDKIFVEREEPISMEELKEKLMILQDVVLQGDKTGLRTLMMRLVPTYHNADEVK